MENPSKVDQVHTLCEELFGDRPRNFPSGASPFIDISRPNFHDSKSEFLLELKAVEAVIGHCEGILSQLIGQDRDAPSYEEMMGRLVPVINLYALQGSGSARINSSNDSQ